MNKPYLIVFLFAILFSCSSSDDSSEPIRLVKMKFTTYNNGNSIRSIFSYNYDENYRLEQATSENENGILTVNFNYTGDNITLIEYSNGESRSYLYDNDLVVSSIHASKTYQYQYNSSQQMITQSEFIGQDLLCIKNFQYDNNDNPILSEDLCNGFSNEFDYDTKKNPNGALLPNNFLKITPLGKNNATVFVNEINTSGNTITNVTTTSFEYNSDNYPTKIICYNEEGDLRKMEEYFYE